MRSAVGEDVVGGGVLMKMPSLDHSADECSITVVDVNRVVVGLSIRRCMPVGRSRSRSMKSMNLR